MKKLMLTNEQAAFAILGEYAALYGDNGGDPDGNCWLPSNLDIIPAELAEQVVAAGHGQMVEVRMATDEGMVNYLAQEGAAISVFGLRVRLAEDRLTDEDKDRLKDAANELELQWAHYGAYGAGDSEWVFILP